MIHFLLKQEPPAPDFRIFANQEYFGPKEWTIAIFFLLLLFAYPIYGVVKSTQSLKRYKRWQKNVFLNYLEFDQDNLLKAYVGLAGKVIEQDTRDVNEKIKYMQSHFSKYFKETEFHVGQTLANAFHNPVELKDVGAWLSMNLTQRSERLQILYFLGGLAVVDGFMRKTEMSVLRQICEVLNLTPKDFESVIAMYTRVDEQRKQSSTRSTHKTEMQRCCEVLGISIQASMDEIKKAYRALAKQHHPDLFATASKEQQLIAEERFLEIQKAYEYLEIHK